MTEWNDESQDLLDDLIRRLEEAWRSGDEVDLAQFVPAADHPMRQSALVALIKVDQELRWQRGDHKSLQQYLADWPELQSKSEVIAELQAAENELRAEINRPRPPADDAANTRDFLPPAENPAPQGVVHYFGDYELLERLGKGGMGIVYKANQLSLKRHVAVKMILAGQLADQQDVARFRSEAESAASLDHPNIVQIYEIGEHQGQHYFSMRYVEGVSLADRLRTSPLPAGEAARLIEQVARAIAYAHGRGVVHRDLKPANILVDRQNQPHVTDFGLAKRVQGDNDLTASGQVIGTPSYMPPEQAAGRLRDISERSDIYSLGATLYALLVGRPPFQADNPLDTLMQVREQQPVSLCQLNPKLPRDLETICGKCLEKDPRRRYGSSDELASELKRFLEGRPIQARPIGRFERFWRWCKRQPIIAGLTSAVAVSLVLGIAISTGFAIKWAERSREANEQRGRAEHQSRLARLGLYNVGLQRVQDLHRRDTCLAHAMLHDSQIFPYDLRDFSWNVLDGLTELATKQFTGPPGAVTSLAFFPDSERIASLGGDGAVRIWNVRNGIELNRLQPENDLGVSMAISLDGKLIAIGCKSGAIEILEMNDFHKKRKLKHHRYPVVSLAWSPNGELLASADGGPTSPWEVRDPNYSIHECVLWDIASDKPANVETNAKVVAFFPDGKTLASTGFNRRISLIDIAAKHSTYEMQYTTDFGEYGSGYSSGFLYVDSVAISSDGRYVAAACKTFGDGIPLWDTTTKRQAAFLLGHQGDVESLSFLQSSQSMRGHPVLASAGQDGTVRLWDCETHENITVIRPAYSGPQALACSPDGQQIAVGSDSGTISVFSIAAIIERDNVGPRQYRVEIRPNTDVLSATLSPSGKLIAAGLQQAWDVKGNRPRVIQLWSASDGRALSTFTTPYSNAIVAFSPNEECLAFTGQTQSPEETIVQIRNLQDGKEVMRSTFPLPAVTSITFSGDGQLLAVGGRAAHLGDPTENDQGWYAVLNSPSGSAVGNVSYCKGVVNGLGFSRDSRLLGVATGTIGEGHVVIEDVRKGERVADFPAHGGAVTLIAFSPSEDILASGGADKKIVIWSVDDFRKMRTLSGHLFGITKLGFSCDGRTVVSGGGEAGVGMFANPTELKLWDPATGTERMNLLGHKFMVHSATFAKDAQVLVSSDRKAIYIWGKGLWCASSMHESDSLNGLLKLIPREGD